MGAGGQLGFPAAGDGEPTLREVTQLRCPRCRRGIDLVRGDAEIAESRCPRCALSFLYPEGARRFLAEVMRLDGPELNQVLAGTIASSNRCPRCSGLMRETQICGTPAEACSSCGAVTLSGASLQTLSNGRYGQGDAVTQTAPAPLRGASTRGGLDARPSELAGPGQAVAMLRGASLQAAPERAGRLTALVAAVSFVALLGAGAIAYKVATRPHALTAVPLDAAAAPVPVDIGQDVLKDYVYGGQTVRWWSQRLTSLRSRNDATGQALYQLTERRAKANGLEVAAGSGAAVTVTPSKTLLVAIGSRLGAPR